MFITSILLKIRPGVYHSEESNRNPYFPDKILNFSGNRNIILWLQSIHHIYRKPSFVMKLSLIFTLTAQVILSLISKLFIDSVSFIVYNEA